MEKNRERRVPKEGERQERRDLEGGSESCGWVTGRAREAEASYEDEDLDAEAPKGDES